LTLLHSVLMRASTCEFWLEKSLHPTRSNPDHPQ
jgi:hypothetical protein